MAAWQASNCGLRGDLLDFGTFRPAPAAEVVEALVDYVAPVLAEQGELELAREGMRRILDRGTGSEQQRRAMEENLAATSDAAAGLAAVVADAVDVSMRPAEAVAPREQAPVLLRVRQS
jgi:carboxylate-amine ligase